MPPSPGQVGSGWATLTKADIKTEKKKEVVRESGMEEGTVGRRERGKEGGRKFYN